MPAGRRCAILVPTNRGTRLIQRRKILCPNKLLLILTPACSGSPPRCAPARCLPTSAATTACSRSSWCGRGQQKGYACDIKPGPLQAAQKNIERAGFTGRLQTRLTDGLDGLEDCGLTDIIIAGMGGEVIAGILERAVFLQNPDLRLILQPQSRENVLRDFLAENGFAVQCEEAVLSGKFVYVVMTASTPVSAEP